MTTRRRKKHHPEEIGAKLRDAEAMLNTGKDLAAVLQALEVSEPSTRRAGVRTADEARNCRDAAVNSPNDPLPMSATPAEQDERGC